MHEPYAVRSLVFQPRMRRVLQCLFLVLAALLSCGALLFGNAAHAQAFLDPAAAFRVEASETPGAVELQFTIAPDYYLYRDHFAFEAGENVTLGAATMPQGTVKFDPTFDKELEVYHRSVKVHLPVLSASGPFDLRVRYQGCSDKGVCYPPQDKVIHVAGAALQTSSATNRVTAAVPAAAGTAGAGGNEDSFGDRLASADYARSVLEGRHLGAVLGIFFLLGIGLSLLPCSLPMVPILSSIIVGGNAATARQRAFLLSVVYVLGMALVYTLFGVAAAAAGKSLGAALQNPWVLGFFGLLLLAFALSMLGFYEFQLPQSWQSRAGQASAGRRGGRLLAVFLMGALSALVVGACMTAPLFGVLAFIAQSGDVFFGAAALFSMALGLGVPLLLVGLGAGFLLPRAGAWMDGVKRVFGVVLLAAALWVVRPILPDGLLMLLWGVWLMLAALGFWRGFGTSGTDPAQGLGHRNTGGRLLAQAIGASLAVLSVLLLVGAAAGGRDPLAPLSVFTQGGSALGLVQPRMQAGEQGQAGLAERGGIPGFSRVTTMAELDRALKSAGRPALVFYHADWCVSCKEMERFTFTDARVAELMKPFALIDADVTANSADSDALMKRFGLFGPPAAVFFDRSGKELPTLRVIGAQGADRFANSLQAVLAALEPQG